MKTFYSIILSFTVFVSSLMAQTYNKNYIDGKLYLKFKNEFKIQLNTNEKGNINLSAIPLLKAVSEKYDISKIFKAFNFKKINENLNNVYVVEFPDYLITDKLVNELNKLPFIDYVEKVPLYELAYKPNDPLYNAANGNRNWNWHLDMIKADSAWNIAMGNPNIVACVIDNAIWKEHEDLKDAIIESYNTIDGTSNCNPPENLHENRVWNHGTHTAGLLAARNDNGIGVASVAGGISLIAVRFAMDNGNLTLPTAAYNWVANKDNIDVISMSIKTTSYSSTEETLFQNLYDNGVVLVAAAGNDSISEINYPAGYSSVISVASVDGNLNKSAFSNYGSTVDISAPGGFMADAFGNLSTSISVLSTSWTYPINTANQFTSSYYETLKGTSMACPIVASVVGLMLSCNPDLTPAEVKNCLLTTVTPDTSSYEIGAGIVNAKGACQCAAELVTKKPIAVISPKNNDTIVLVGGTAVKQFNDLSQYAPTQWDWVFQSGVADATDIKYPKVTYSTAGTFSVTLTATNSFGSDDTTITFVVIDDVKVDKYNSNPDIKIYPTPANDVLNINNIPLTKNAKINIYDIVGNIVYNSEINYNEKNKTLNISNLNEGVYFIKINADNFSYVKKFSKID